MQGGCCLLAWDTSPTSPAAYWAFSPRPPVASSLTLLKRQPPVLSPPKPCLTCGVWGGTTSSHPWLPSRVKKLLLLPILEEYAGNKQLWQETNGFSSEAKFLVHTSALSYPSHSWATTAPPEDRTHQDIWEWERMPGSCRHCLLNFSFKSHQSNQPASCLLRRENNEDWGTEPEDQVLTH